MPRASRHLAGEPNRVNRLFPVGDSATGTFLEIDLAASSVTLTLRLLSGGTRLASAVAYRGLPMVGVRDEHVLAEAPSHGCAHVCSSNFKLGATRCVSERAASVAARSVPAPVDGEASRRRRFRAGGSSGHGPLRSAGSCTEMRWHISCLTSVGSALLAVPGNSECPISPLCSWSAATAPRGKWNSSRRHGLSGADTAGTSGLFLPKPRHSRSQQPQGHDERAVSSDPTTGLQHFRPGEGQRTRCTPASTD